MDILTWIRISNVIITVAYIGGGLRLITLLLTMAREKSTGASIEKTLRRMYHLFIFLSITSSYFSIIGVAKHYFK